MNNKSFDDKRIASGYAKDRPFLHSQMIELVIKDMDIRESFAKGLDVGCGAGLSSKALKMICDRVTGTDISSEMVAEASALYSNPPYDFFQSSAEEIKAPENTFDIVTAAGVIGWVEEEKFLPNLFKIMKKKRGFDHLRFLDYRSNAGECCLYRLVASKLPKGIPEASKKRKCLDTENGGALRI